ncbi:PAS domain-containing protein [Marivirga sp. S37H4]|uniref:histidine kinase n=1 Tax=Marivirga aurantiaca TaxID=2802615 RepID=A0A934WZ08_9BACT|nr:ATP-binding protein [Marivirga aurantiaca]MBK6265385.1 PAS domain-containing protein [Marivirga aurantiaca]
MADLRELNEELENYFRNTVIPQLFFDAHFILRKFTPPAMKLFNLSQKDLGRHISDISDNIRYPTILENITEVMETQQDFEKEIQTTDFKWYQMNILPYITRKEGKSNGVIITFVDITDRIETLKAFEKLNRNFENIFYTVSHDLKGPIGNVEVLIQLLKDAPDKESEDAKSIIELLIKSVKNLKQTIEEITDISDGIDSHSLDKQVGRIYLEKIVRDVQLSLKDKIAQSNARITTEFNIPEIKFSRRKIRSIIYNLLSNAIKYTASEQVPEIFIKTEKLDDFILLTVKDNGIGIATDKHEAVFSRYTRIVEDVEGTGVGLFIVKRMVEDSGGKIEVESSLGKGSTFKVYIKE